MNKTAPKLPGTGYTKCRRFCALFIQPIQWK